MKFEPHDDNDDNQDNKPPAKKPKYFQKCTFSNCTIYV